MRRGTAPAESACCCLGLSRSNPERGSEPDTDRGVAWACPIRGVMISSGLGATALTDEGRLARLRASEERPWPDEGRNQGSLGGNHEEPSRLRASEERPWPEPVVSELVLQRELVGVFP